MENLVAGYSIRSLSPDADWEGRRENFLIRPEILLPKSVDYNAWEEVVHNEVDTTAGRLPLPCWNDREAMRVAFHHAKYKDESIELTIGIHLNSDEETNISRDDRLHTADLFLLGYDIADDGLTSALSNCEYSAPEMIVARNMFAPFINDHGLIDNMENALRFRDYSSTRVPEHTPFFVYSLWTDRRI